MGMGGYGGMGNMGGMEGECCPMKKIWGSMKPKMDGMYVNVGKKNWNMLPWKCNSPCIYEKKGSWDNMQYCFANSMTSQSECAADMDDGEEPVNMGSGSVSYGEDPVDMGSGSGSGGSKPVDMGSGSGSDGGKPGSGSGSGKPGS